MATHPQTTLDRDQRGALRHEIEVEANAYGDFEYALREGDRSYVLRHLARLRGLVEALDAIGWTEQPGAPDEQDVSPNAVLVEWARGQAEELRSAFAEDCTPSDEDLDVFGALVTIAGA
jgi:hypothetical protein